MDAIIYILFSIFDGLAIFIFAFNSFRIKLIDYWKEIIFTVSIISVGTYFFSESVILSNLTPLITIILFIVALLFYFRISLLSALRVTIVGFVAQMVALLIILTIVSVIFGVNLSEIKENELLKYPSQFIGDLLAASISFVLKKNKIWVTSLPYDYTIKFKLSKTNIILVVISSVIIISMILIPEVNNAIILLAFWSLVLLNISIMEIRKEKRHYIDR